DRVVHDLLDHVVQAALTGGADVHARALADRLEALEDGDVRGVVVLRGVGGPLTSGGGRDRGRPRRVDRSGRRVGGAGGHVLIGHGAVAVAHLMWLLAVLVPPLDSRRGGSAGPPGQQRRRAGAGATRHGARVPAGAAAGGPRRACRRQKSAGTSEDGGRTSPILAENAPRTYSARRGCGRRDADPRPDGPQSPRIGLRRPWDEAPYPAGGDRAAQGPCPVA